MVVFKGLYAGNVHKKYDIVILESPVFYPDIFIFKLRGIGRSFFRIRSLRSIAAREGFFLLRRLCYVVLNISGLVGFQILGGNMHQSHARFSRSPCDMRSDKAVAGRK